MKKLFLGIAMFFLVVLFFAVQATFAAWTITATDYKDTSISWTSGVRIHVVKVHCISDGADPDEFLLSTYYAYMGKIQGAMLYQITTDPGTAPDAVWDVSFDDELGGDILGLTGLSVTATEIHDASTDLGFYPIVFDVQIDIADIGTAADVVDIYLYFMK